MKLELTKERINELGSNDLLAEELGLGFTSTTSERNGYPENVRHAIISDSIDELNGTIEHLESLGLTVEKFELHKRDGWGLWARNKVWGFEDGQYQTINDQDYYFDFNPEWPEEEAKAAIAEETTGNQEVVEDLFKDMKRAKSETRFFLDPNNSYSIDHGVSKDAACYSYDTHNYQLAIMVDFNIEDE